MSHLYYPIQHIAVPFQSEWLGEEGFLTNLAYPYFPTLGLPVGGVIVKATTCVQQDRIVTLSNQEKYTRQELNLAVIYPTEIIQDLRGGKRATITPAQVEISNATTCEVLATYRSFIDSASGTKVWSRVRQAIIADYVPGDHLMPATVEALFLSVESMLRRQWTHQAQANNENWRRDSPWGRLNVQTEVGPLKLREALWFGEVNKGWTFGFLTPTSAELDLYRRVQQKTRAWVALPIILELRKELAALLIRRREEARYTGPQ